MNRFEVIRPPLLSWENGDLRLQAFGCTCMVRRSVVLRICLLAIAVLVCHQFEWRVLRSATCECIFLLSTWAGIPVQRLTSDVLLFNGRTVEFVTSCTQIDVYCASIPLIWNFAAGARANCMKLAAYFACLFLFNIARLEAGHLLLARGVPWVIAHEAIGGVNLFIIFLWVVRNRGWQSPLPTHSSDPIKAPA
jgi:hypothetical protein